MDSINRNILRNKSDMLTTSVNEYKDLLMISKTTKLDNTISHAFYHPNNFSKPNRLHRNSHGGEILVT